MSRFLFASVMAVAYLFSYPAAAQRTVKKSAVAPRPTARRLAPVTPLSWATQQRRAVPQGASFRYEVTCFDATDQPITDTLLALTDTKWLQCVRRDNRTQAPVGLVRQLYWPSLRPAGEGKLAVVDGEDTPVGPWVYWYDHAPSERNKRQQVSYDAQGQPIGGTLQQWTEMRPDCRYVLDNALPTATSKLTCQFCTGSSRVVVPVDLPAEALGIIVKFDIRDEAQGLASFQNLAALAASFTVGGPTAALNAYAVAWRNKDIPPAISTKCTYFITTDGEAAQRWYLSKGQDAPAPATMLYAPAGNVTNETRPLLLASPVQHLYLCVQNDNVHTDAVATVSVAALRQPCP